MELLENERSALRSELQFLKGCQLQYFLLSVGAAGAVVGFGKRWGGESPNAVFLAPLLVIIPCWWIFFDKATTITRIVGYYRVLEGIIHTGSSAPFHHVGWENALALFREKQRSAGARVRFKSYGAGLWIGLTKSLVFRTTQRYWVINWLTFLVLGLASLRLALPESHVTEDPVWCFLAGVLAITTFHNLSILGRLTDGTYSYSRNFALWKEVLRSREAEDYLQKTLELETKPEI